MKRLNIILVLMALSFSAFAQEKEVEKEVEKSEFKTIFGNKDGSRHNGGYGGISTGYSQIGGRDAILIGGHGAYLINGKFGIGISGTGFMTDKTYDQDLGANFILAGGYGGLRLEYIINPDSPVNVSIPVVIGGGGISYTRTNNDFSYYNSLDEEAFFLFEPGIEIQLNVVKFMRMSFGASYRFSSEVASDYLDNVVDLIPNDPISGFTGTISFKFGKF